MYPVLDPARRGVASVGLVPNTNKPEPVSSVTALARLALDGVAKKVATPVPKPAMPVLTGRPVQLVSTPDVGVPSKGVTKAGLLLKTRAPVPVSSVTAAARLALEGVARNVPTLVPKPLMPVLTGRPVQLVRTPAEGVPMLGVTRAGLAVSALVAMAVAMLVNSVENSEPLITFDGLPEDRASLAPKLVVTAYDDKARLQR